MMQQARIVDEPLVQRIRQFVADQFARAKQLGAARVEYKEAPNDFFFFLLGAIDSVEVWMEDSGIIQLEFGSQDEKPRYNLHIHPGGEIRTMYWGEDSIPDLNSQLQHMSRLSIAPSPRVPYGWVEAGRITALLWLDTTYANCEKPQFVGVDCYVVSGATPSNFRMAPHASDDEASEWLARFWGLPAEGKLVRLGQRIRALPAEAWAIGGGGKQHHLWFDASDGVAPQLVAQTPYIRRHYTEDHPGQKEFSRDVAAYRHPLRSWFLP